VKKREKERERREREKIEKEYFWNEKREFIHERIDFFHIYVIGKRMKRLYCYICFLNMY